MIIKGKSDAICVNECESVFASEYRMIFTAIEPRQQSIFYICSYDSALGRKIQKHLSAFRRKTK